MAIIHAHGIVCGYDKEPLSEIEADLLEKVKKKIGYAISKIRSDSDDPNAPVFVKLNHRSPKDVAIEPGNKKTRDALLLYLRDLPESDEISQVRDLGYSRVLFA